MKLINGKWSEFFCLIMLNILVVLSNVDSLPGIKCICNPDECDVIRENDCPGKGSLVWDSCKCCKVCAKIEGESCGGPGNFSGICESPLKCISKPPLIGAVGICLDLPSVVSEDRVHAHKKILSKNHDCDDIIEIKPGCEIVDRKCLCWKKSIRMCRRGNLDQISKWDFMNKEECELNLSNIIETEKELDEDYQLITHSPINILNHESHVKNNFSKKRIRNFANKLKRPKDTKKYDERI